MKLAIIGTAGRKENASKLSRVSWTTMMRAANHLVDTLGIVQLVSGGAAWADHVAIQLTLDNDRLAPALIHLPGHEQAISTMRYYHQRFTEALRLLPTSLEQIEDAEYDGNIIVTRRGGFHERNQLVAQDADVFLACTFGHCQHVKDGGTAHTVRHMRAMGKRGYHLDLNTNRLFANAEAP